MSSKIKKNTKVDDLLSDDSSDVQVSKKAPAKKDVKKRKESNVSEDSVNLLKNKKNGKEVKKPKKEDSDSDSDDKKKKVTKVSSKPAAKKIDSDSEEEEKTKKNGKAAPAKQAKKKDSDSDDSDSEDKPKKHTRKTSNVSGNSKGKKKPVAKDSDSEDEGKVVKNNHSKKQEEVADDEDGHKEIFVKNLSFKSTQDSVWEHFQQFGNVVNVKVLTDRETGRARGMGFVEFEKRADAKKAIANPGEFDGREPQCSFSNEKKDAAPRDNNRGGQGGFQSSHSGPTHTIFIGSLGYKTNEHTIKNFFSGCGNVVGVRIAKHEDGKAKGFCHVDFDSAEACAEAVKLTGQELDGREIRIDHSEPRKNRDDGGSRGGFGGGRGRGGFGGRGGDRGGRGGGRGGFNKPSYVAAGKKTTFNDDSD